LQPFRKFLLGFYVCLQWFFHKAETENRFNCDMRDFTGVVRSPAYVEPQEYWLSGWGWRWLSGQ
jgi:hypothetical protein